LSSRAETLDACSKPKPEPTARDAAGAAARSDAAALHRSPIANTDTSAGTATRADRRSATRADRMGKSPLAALTAAVCIACPKPVGGTEARSSSSREGAPIVKGDAEKMSLGES